MKGVKMLVLTRVKGESIMIGDGIEVSIVDVRGDKVRLGFSAPPNITIHRKEVWLAIKAGVPERRKTRET